jgi:hypothetical protein
MLKTEKLKFDCKAGTLKIGNAEMLKTEKLKFDCKARTLKN